MGVPYQTIHMFLPGHVHHVPDISSWREYSLRTTPSMNPKAGADCQTAAKHWSTVAIEQ